MDVSVQGNDAVRVKSRRLLCVLCASALCAAGLSARGDTVSLFEDDFETGPGNWASSGAWHIQGDSACQAEQDGYVSPTHALAFNDESGCAYANDASGFAAMAVDVTVPATALAATLRWWDYVGAEQDGDYYFVQVSTDGGVTWPDEVYRRSADEKVWNEEVVDLSQYVGQGIRVRFGFSSDSSVVDAGWYVDDVSMVYEVLPAGVSALAVGDAAILEGDSGAGSLVFPVTVVPENDSVITLDYATEDGSALAGSDYVSAAGTLEIPAHTGTASIEVSIAGDQFSEEDEAFTLVLSNPSPNGFVVDASAVGTITDDDPLVCLFSTDFDTNYEVADWDPSGLWHRQESSACLAGADGYVSPTHAMAFNDEPTCSYFTGAPVTGALAMATDVAVPGTALSAELRFSSFPGYLQTTDDDWARVEISTDAGAEWRVLRYVEASWRWDEGTINLDDYIGQSIRVRFVFSAGNLLDLESAGWYIDDVAICYAALPPNYRKVIVAPAAVAEGNAGSVNLTFSVTISPPDGPAASVSFETRELDAGNAATEGTDFTPTSGVLEIAAETSGDAEIAVPVLGDTIPEFDEQFELVLGVQPGDVILGSTVATGTILNDDVLSSVTVSPQTASENAGTVAFTVSVDPVLSYPMTIHYATQDGTAWAGIDYESASGTLSFPADTGTAAFQVVLLDDAFSEGDKSFHVSLTPDTPSAVGGVATITIHDDEPAAAPRAYFFDDFESGDGNWHRMGGDWSGLWQLQEDSQCISGGHGYVSPTHAMAFSYEETCECPAYASASIAMANSVTIPDAAFSATLSWWDFVSFGNPFDSCFVQLSVDDGATWPYELYRRGTDSTEWDQVVVDLAGFVGQTIRVRFGFVSNGDASGMGWYIDDVRIEVFEPPADIHYYEDFESGLIDFVVSGAWHVQESSGCLAGEDGYVSPANAVVFNYEDAPCAYGNNESGFLTMTVDTPIPETASAAFLTWWDYVGAEPGADFYFVEVSSDGGLTWHEVYRGSDDDKTWNRESADISAYIGQQVRARFGFTSNGSVTGVGWYVDDIRIEVLDEFANVSMLTVHNVQVAEGSPADASASEAVSEGNDAVFTVRLHAPNASDIHLEYATQDVSAAAGTDYQDTSGPLTIYAGETETTIRVPVFADYDVETSEQFELVLSHPSSNALVANHVVTGTITNDDFPRGTVFGRGYSSLYRYRLDEVLSPVELEGDAGYFDAVEFRGFDLSLLYGWQRTSDPTTQRFVRVNADTGEVAEVAQVTFADRTMTSLAWDRINRLMYAVAAHRAADGSTMSWLYTVDLTTGALTSVGGASSAYVAGLAAHPSTGRLYALAYSGDPVHQGAGQLYEVSKTDGSLTLIGETGYHPQWGVSESGILGCDFDDATGNLYASVFVAGGGSELRQIDTEDGSSTLVSSSPPTTGGLTIAEPPPPVDAWWTGDVHYGTAPPSGVDMAAHNNDLTGSDAGNAVSGIGDVNDDGYEDFVIAAHHASAGPVNEAGKVFLFYGPILQYMDQTVVFGRDYPDGANGITLAGSATGECLGTSVAGLGDFNGDGIDDFAIGYVGQNHTGGAYVIYGNYALPDTVSTADVGGVVSGLKLQGIDGGDDAGFSVSGAGDLNADGLGDLLMGAPHRNGDQGECYLVFGADGLGSGGVLDLGALTPPDGIRIYGTAAGDLLGYAVGGAGDVNGDGVDDILVGAPGGSGAVGSAYLFYGHADYYGPAAPGSIDLASVSLVAAVPGIGQLAAAPSQIPGVWVQGEYAGGEFGASLRGVGDVDNDGLADVLIGAPKYDGERGTVYLVVGQSSYVTPLAISDLGTSAAGVRLEGIHNGDLTGKALAGAGDINGDGFMDVLVGVERGDPELFTDSGQVFVLYGSRNLAREAPSPTSLRLSDVTGEMGVRILNTLDTLHFGRALSSAGDLSGDAIPELVSGRSGGAGGAMVFGGGSIHAEAAYRNRMRGSAGTDLSIDERLATAYLRGVGVLGDRSQSLPLSRAAIEFVGGGRGSGYVSASTQEVTVFRQGVPDPGEDWVPSSVYWQIETDRLGFSRSTIEFHYLPEEIEGLAVDDLGVFFTRTPPTESSAWEPLPTTLDPVRHVLTVARIHDTTDPRTSQTSFNGYYAILEAHLKYRLGEPIPPVGVTSQNIDPNGPEVLPEAAAFWHRRDGILYATAAGPIEIRWKAEGVADPVSIITATNIWPEDPDTYQIHVAGSAPVDLTNQGGGVEFAYARLTSTDGTTDADSNAVETSQEFSAPGPGRSLIMLSPSANLDTDTTASADVYFQFVQSIVWNDPAHLDNQPATIGQEIETPAYHTADGGPFVLNGLARYCADAGYYDRTTRTGPIIPVNVDRPGIEGDDLVVVYYEEGSHLVRRETDPAQAIPVSTAYIEWPYKPVRYDAQWPSSPDTIVIASLVGTGAIPPATYGSEWSIYDQPDPSQAGFNPNDEHAMRVQLDTGWAILPLRDDLGTDTTSQPYVLMKYREPTSEKGGEDARGAAKQEEGRPRIKVFRVVAEQAPYFFQYEGSAGRLIQPPFPLSTLPYCDETQAVSGPAFEDRTGRHYAMAAGDDGGPAQIVMEFYYPVQPGFFFPDGAHVPGDRVPWLDRGTGTPVNVTFTVHWPDEPTIIKVGQTRFQGISGQCSVDILYQQSLATGGGPSVALIDPVQAREASLAQVPGDINTAGSAELVFVDLSPALRLRVGYDPISQRLRFWGLHVTPDLGSDYALLNVMTERDLSDLLDLSTDPGWTTAVNALYLAARDPIEITDSSVPTDDIALTAGFARGVGYVTLAMQNADRCEPDPISLEIFKVAAELDPGSIAVITPECPFDEKLTLRHTGDFAGRTDEYLFEWRYLPDVDGTPPANPNDFDAWYVFTPEPASGEGAVDVTIKGPGLLTLSDNWFICRYLCTDDGVPWAGVWSEPTPAQLAEGWIKRVVGDVDGFTQAATGGGIQGAEDRFLAYADTEINTVVSMIAQAGPPWTGDVPLNCESLDDFGLLEVYETVLGRGIELSIDGLPPVNYPPANTALLLVAGRIADLYMLLGNEAYADAADPTIAFGTDDGQYGAEASSIHCFMNQTRSLLEEELALLRGRDDSVAPGVRLHPVYNRLIWNFTNDINGGEVAYALNYNIRDENGDAAGVINESDAKQLYPQGHGDAWGHYLTAISTYYKLLRHPNYTWNARSEGVLVGGQPVTVDYLDERKFAAAAAAKARAGAEMVNLTYRSAYVEDPAGQWQGYQDDDTDRAWGLSEWASRAGQGAYLDWVVGNAILPAEDTEHEQGIQKIDRTTVLELREVASQFQEIQSQADMADLGLNPLGLATNVIPFDISPSEIDAGKTHFEQIYDRAVVAINNAITVFNHANNATQMLRRQADTETEFQHMVENQEADFENRLIELFGYPYADDIGPGKTYPTGYDGPDLYHYTYVDPSELVGADEASVLEFVVTITDLDVQDDGALNETAQDVTFHLSTSADRFGLIKPSTWTGERRAPGEIQLARSDLIIARVRFERALRDYADHVAAIEDQAALIEAQYDLNAEEINVLNTELRQQQGLNSLITQCRQRQLGFRTGANMAVTMANALAEALPTTVGLSTDATSAARSAIRVAGAIAGEGLSVSADLEGLAELDHQQAKEVAQAQTNITLTTARGEFAVLQQLAQLEQLVRQEAALRLELYTMQEAMQQASGRYLAALARGQRLLEERRRFRSRTAASVQSRRYKDMAFRIFRNDALQKYRAQFDLAARYVYLAAKAYDFETTFLSSDERAGSEFLTDIVRTRLIGTIESGLPQTGQGLADPMARMSQNFSVLRGQLGFSNPQRETNRFSLRSELFRTQPGRAGNALWRETLRRHVAPNLLELPEFQRYARVFQPYESVEPGIVIPFETSIDFGLNFFGWPLGGGDNAYDSTNFATKVRSVGVWFSNYNNLGEGMSNTPRVYLIPVGADVLRSATGLSGVTREFTVLDQVLPVPFPVTSTDLVDNPSWIPSLDTTSDVFVPVRRYASFRAYHDSGEFRVEEAIRDSRLIGRSVWNTKWLLIIPAGTLHSDREEGLNRFIDGALVGDERDGNGVSDIKIFFETYAYSGTK